MSLNFATMCRICLLTNKITYYDIYTSFYSKNNTLYSEMLASCTKLKPSWDDHLPNQICKDCCRQLKKTYSFNVQCEESDRILKSMLMNQISLDLKGEIKKIDSNNDLLSDEVKVENDLDNHNECRLEISMLEQKEQLNGIVKKEPNFDVKDDNDSNWDAEDDNLNLEEIKLKKNHTQQDIKELSSNALKPKKRGRKKKVYSEGQTPLPESKMPHQCDICGKFLSTKSNLNTHKICHTDLRPFKCLECSATFKGHSALFQHKRIHSGEKPYHCEYCPKRFSRRTGLINHIRMHTGEKLFSCDLCCKNFVQSAQLAVHKKRHTGDKTFLCQECGKGFPVQADLKVHQRVHNGEKPYSCHLCTKTFATSGNLAIHIRIHKREVRYNCKFCLLGFVTYSSYSVHMKRHKGQRDYHCECGKTFYTSSALKSHKVVHTGERKYQCKICERKFTQTSHLNRHFKRDHGKPNDPLPPPEQYKVILNNTSKESLEENLKIINTSEVKITTDS